MILGTKRATTATMDGAGRLVIPKSIRRQAGLEGGVLLEVRLEDGRVVLEPAPRPVTVIRQREFYVAEPMDGTEEALSSEDVEATLDRLRREDR